MNQAEDNSLNEQDLRLLKAYLDTEEKKKAFITTYMYILNVGNGDGITESELLDSEELGGLLNESEELNENLVGNVLAFFKGKKNIGKYYKGLDAAAKNYISATKNIDKLDQDKRADKRKKALDTYNNTVKSLDAIKKEIDELKKESKILTKLDSFANNKYKLKMALTGRKAGVSLSKLKGHEDNLDKIKKEQETLKKEIAEESDDIKAAKKERKKAEKGAEKKIKKDDKKETEEDSTVADDRKAKIKAEVESMRKKLLVLTKQKIQLTKKKADSAKIKEIGDKIDDMEKKIVNKNKELKESNILSLSFFQELESLNEDFKCLENLIEENL
jgi:hypothetical protein